MSHRSAPPPVVRVSKIDPAMLERWCVHSIDFAPSSDHFTEWRVFEFFYITIFLCYLKMYIPSFVSSELTTQNISLNFFILRFFPAHQNRIFLVLFRPTIRIVSQWLAAPLFLYLVSVHMLFPVNFFQVWFYYFLRHVKKSNFCRSSFMLTGNIFCFFTLSCSQLQTKWRNGIII